jgi:hypothetical protein
MSPSPRIASRRLVAPFPSAATPSLCGRQRTFVVASLQCSMLVAICLCLLMFCCGASPSHPDSASRARLSAFTSWFSVALTPVGAVPLFASGAFFPWNCSMQSIHIVCPLANPLCLLRWLPCPCVRYAGSGVTISDDLTTIVTSSGSQSLVLGSRGFTRGVHYWEIKVDSQAQHGNIFIGKGCHSTSLITQSVFRRCVGVSFVPAPYSMFPPNILC